MFPTELSGGFAFSCEIAIALFLMVFIFGTCWRRHTSLIFPILTGLGSLLLLISGIMASDANFSIPLPLFLGDSGIIFIFDPLSRWFLCIIGLVGIPIAFFSSGYLKHLTHRVSISFIWAFLGLLMASMCGVVLAANAIVFLVAWELMALSSFALVAADHGQRSIRQAAFIYLGATRTGTAFLMTGFLWIHHLTGSWDFVDWHINGTTALGPALLIFIGLAVKAGCWPFHLWLPIAHPAAPAPVSAVMSGVMIKTAIYTMIRLFILKQHLSPPSLGLIILILGAISALWGVLFALLQHDLKRLLAYHSVENIGIILMGLGISILGMQYHMPMLAHLGLAAALFHTLNHAIFKSLLFLGTGAVDAQTHLRDIERLGGLIHRMPWTAGAFIVGSAAICALPPLNGFASEWLLYQGFFTLAATGPSVLFRLGAIFLMGWLGLIGALAVACFVKAVSVVFLGIPRSANAEHASEVGRGMIFAQVFLGIMCLMFGITVPGLLGLLSQITAPLGGNSFILPNTWTVPTGLLIVLLVLTTGVLMVLMKTLSRLNPTRQFITWECGFGSLGPRTQYTATSFAQPISRLFSVIYNYAVHVKMRGHEHRHYPEAITAETLHKAYLETRFYSPAIRGIRRICGVLIMRLQAGSIHQYLVFMVLVLALLLWVGYR